MYMHFQQQKAEHQWLRRCAHWFWRFPRQSLRRMKIGKKAVVSASKTMQTLVQTSPVNTAWSDTLVPRTKMKIDDGNVSAVQAFVRVPKTKADQMLKLSGMNEDFIFLR